MIVIVRKDKLALELSDLTCITYSEPSDRELLNELIEPLLTTPPKQMAVLDYPLAEKRPWCMTYGHQNNQFRVCIFLPKDISIPLIRACSWSHLNELWSDVFRYTNPNDFNSLEVFVSEAFYDPQALIVTQSDIPPTQICDAYYTLSGGKFKKGRKPKVKAGRLTA